MNMVSKRIELFDFPNPDVHTPIDERFISDPHSLKKILNSIMSFLIAQVLKQILSCLSIEIYESSTLTIFEKVNKICGQN
jgi:hypothetical protein